MRKSLIAMSALMTMIVQTSKAQKLNLAEHFHTQQIVVVTAANDTTIQAEMNVYELAGKKWKAKMEHIPVTIGRTGLAWAKGLHDEKLNTGELKKEGDGKSPAGIFQLNSLFGYEDIKTKMDYLKVTETTFCVDDATSSNYNRIVNTDTTTKNWTSAEEMRRKDDVYKYGVIVGYNTDQIVQGGGSCIFMHLWRGSDRPTAGCTAMTEQNMLLLFKLLDPKKKPLLVQATKEGYAKMNELYELPSVGK